MRLADFFATVAPFLEGRTSHAEAVRALYGPGMTPGDSVDARRLAIYGRFCRTHRFEVVDGVYPHLRDVVRARGGDAAWEELVEAYFRHHPMRHFELNANGAELPTFLSGYVSGAGLPAWLPELADFEWWEWQTIIAPSDEAACDGPRLSASVELRPYQHDLVGWLARDPHERPPEPEPGECLVLFWRDPELRLRRENVRTVELLVLKAVSEGLPLDAVAASAGVAREEVVETFHDLSRAGIIVGVRGSPAYPRG